MTGLTYTNRHGARGDRRQQEHLLAALDAAPSQLRRDACGLWVIAGRRGSIQTWGDGQTWLVFVIGRSARHWTAMKRRLDFMTVTQDGDEEGCFQLLELPSPREAVLIRDALSLRKRRALTDKARASLIAAGIKGRFRAQEPVSAPGLVSEDLPTAPGGKSAAKPSTSASRMTEPEEAT